MLATLTQYLEGITQLRYRFAVRVPLYHLVDRYSSQPLTSARLVISSGGAATAKTGASDFYASASGVLVKIAAGTAMPALVGSITAASFNVFCFFVDSAGVVTSVMGTEGTTLGTVVFPQFAPGLNGKAMVGFLIVTYASQFVGGTTPLDTATTVYVSPLGPFDPTMLV